jgi:7-cyano-7-deazaguanine synthase in queuosine biosynthesis
VPDGHELRKGKVCVELDALGNNPNTHLKLENVTDPFFHLLGPRLLDLLELAAYIYTADCLVSRELEWTDEKSIEPWSRDFHFVMPVRDLDFWRAEEVQECLVGGLGFLSSDRFRFSFELLKKHRDVQQYLDIVNVDDLPFHGAERVIMFSGGLDSLAGAVESASRGEKVILVSHRPVTKTDRRQTELARLLSDCFRTPIRHIPVWVNKAKRSREPTQRTRSFLFSALGAAVASVLKARGVRFYENGVTSLNWPIAQEVMRSRATRSTHPQALVLLQRFHRLVTEDDGFTIDDPYIFATKTEVVSKIEEHGAGPLIEHSCSCSRTMFQSSAQWHCGCCSQCIDRRIAVQAAGQEDNDPAEGYVSDVFVGPRKDGYERSIAMDYVRFASDINQMTEDAVGARHNAELARAARYLLAPGQAAQQFIEMHKRHAKTVMDVLEAQTRLHSRNVVDGSLEGSSLLAMVARGEHRQAFPQPSSDPVAVATETGNVFRKELHYWTVVFEGKTLRLKHSKGVLYIAFLLKHPGEEFHVLQLVHEVDGLPLPEPDHTYSEMSEGAIGEEGLVVSGFTDAGEIMDIAYEDTCRQGLKDAQKKLKSAQIRQDQVAMRSAQNEIGQFRRALSEGRGLGRRRRRAKDPVENTRSAVSQAIARVLAKIKPDHLSLYEHLDSRIDRGTSLCYRVAPGIDWTF